jgi:hypothetical protein
VDAKVLSAKSVIFLLLLMLMSGAVFCRGRVAAQSPPSNAKTSSWRTYRSQEYGFELKYPAGFVISKDSGGYVVFRAPQAGPRFGLSISRRRQLGKLTLPEFVHNDTAYEQDHSYSYAGESVESRDSMTIYRFRRILGSSTRQGTFFLKDHEEGIMADYLIEYDRCSGGGCGPGRNSGPHMVKDPHTREYDLILSTFRFIKQATTEGGQ